MASLAETILAGAGGSSAPAEGGGDDLTMAAEDLLAAFAESDPAKLANALRAAFQILESQPHDEYEGED